MNFAGTQSILVELNIATTVSKLVIFAQVELRARVLCIRQKWHFRVDFVRKEIPAVLEHLSVVAKTSPHLQIGGLKLRGQLFPNDFKRGNPW